MSSVTLLVICKMGILVDSFGLKTMKMLQVKVHMESLYKNYFRDLSGGSVVKTLSFDGRGHEFDPWLGN